MWEKAIIHSRIEDYYAQVEEILYPNLKDEVMVVGEKNGIVLSKNELANDYCICVGDSMVEALRKYPNLCVVPPHYDDYVYFKEQMKNIYREYSNKVESLDGDIWVDITMCQGFYESPIEIAKEIQQRIYNELGIRVSMGMSFNKLFAKVANTKKDSFGFSVITRRNFKEYAYPCILQKTPYLNQREIDLLRQHNIYTVGGLAYHSLEKLEELLGNKGTSLWYLVRGENIQEDFCSYYEQDVRMVGIDLVSRHLLSTYEEAIELLKGRVKAIAQHLVDYSLKGKYVSIRIRDHHFCEYVLEKRLAISTDSFTTLMDVVDMLMRENCLNHWNGDLNNKIQSISVVIGQITYEENTHAMDLFDLYHYRTPVWFDGLKDKFGSRKMKRSLG